MAFVRIARDCKLQAKEMLLHGVKPSDERYFSAFSYYWQQDNSHKKAKKKGGNDYGKVQMYRMRTYL